MSQGHAHTCRHAHTYKDCMSLSSKLICAKLCSLSSQRHLNLGEEGCYPLCINTLNLEDQIPNRVFALLFLGS